MSMPLFDRLREGGGNDDEDGANPSARDEATGPAEEPPPTTAPRRKGTGAERRDPEVLRVGQLHRVAQAALERQFGEVWVIGELSNVRRNARGHVYFTLNDLEETAALQAVMFQSDARRTRARLEDGAVVRFRGRLGIYPARGAFQLVARIAVSAGAGDLHAEFELRRRRLEAEGLLARPRRPLPKVPRVVGVVTSRTGAALGDVVRVARGRCPVRIVVADCRVQGTQAAGSLRAALEDIQRLPELDVVIIGRGGGASEDLWGFNDEELARAVAGCRVPTVSAVGHEQDVTLIDLVADVRAATPSNAAELVVPEETVLRRDLATHGQRLGRAMEGSLLRWRHWIGRRRGRLGDPRPEIGAGRQALSRAAEDLRDQVRGQLRAASDAIRREDQALRRADPKARVVRDRAALSGATRSVEDHGRRVVAQQRAILDELATRHRGLGRPAVQAAAAELGALAGRLDALSPLRVLERGYAVALGPDGRAVVDADTVRPGDPWRVRLHRGEVRATVTGVELEPTDPDVP